ncbi:uncharacterized protein BCR38DRAFT_441055 [Pseudomassariella vexata]|uniref:BZIP domain-containing protein n=1 Tax=Pseudomassariella vexata TaxID=1141098 RepID=A0A1Y2DRN4_9PEZI|nr:uncharacterized protein BCR38DRAFT_441055 [Pseudomassariella vexata]ORY61756.1 hypothetical protein BCR38DRAFT_441055 [Pseudomassariella vexata]
MSYLPPPSSSGAGLPISQPQREPQGAFDHQGGQNEAPHHGFHGQQGKQREQGRQGQQQQQPLFLNPSCFWLPAHHFPLNVPIEEPQRHQLIDVAQNNPFQPPLEPIHHLPFGSTSGGAPRGHMNTVPPSGEKSGPHLPVPSGIPQRQQQPAQPQTGPSAAGTEASEGVDTRYMHGDLNILRAEQYGDGLPAPKGLVSGGHTWEHPPLGSNSGPVSKKRPRRSVDAEPKEPEEPDEDKKRARGRPRLDTTDQTPQERRRTQIRLAQRAYRNRKESTISDLQKEVDGLKAVNGQMSQAYQDLFKAAARNGLLDQSPDFAQQLLKLQELANHARDDTKEVPKETLSTPERDVEEVSLAPNPPASKSSSGPSVGNAEAAQQPAQQHWGGVVVTHEPIPDQAISHFPRGLPDLTALHHDSPISYEILTQPTSQNASFPPHISFDQSFLTYTPDPSDPTDPTNHNGPDLWLNTPIPNVPSPWNSLPAPGSFAYQEYTFSRRLHREALYRASRLITMDRPPPDRLMRVFGFARLFETYEQIRERTLAMLHQSERQPLHYWKFPFHNLGGAGTHFPALGAGTSDPERNRIIGGGGHGHNQSSGNLNGYGAAGNTGAAGTRPKESAGFAMGPFDPTISRIRDSLLDMGQQIQLPGFDGAFWDADEVEYYMQQNEVSIPGSSEYYAVEIDEFAFGGPSGGVMAASGAEARAGFGEGSGSNPHYDNSASSVVSGVGNMSYEESSNVSMSTGLLSSYESKPSEGFGMPSSMLQVGQTQARQWGQQQNPADAGDLFGITFTQNIGVPGLTTPFDGGIGASLPTNFTDPSLLAANSFPDLSNTPGITAPRPEKRIWRIHVAKLIDQLLSRCTCLGRAPGFRPKDVNSAFWASVVDPTVVQ